MSCSHLSCRTFPCLTYHDLNNKVQLHLFSFCLNLLLHTTFEALMHRYHTSCRHLRLYFNFTVLTFPHGSYDPTLILSFLAIRLAKMCIVMRLKYNLEKKTIFKYMVEKLYSWKNALMTWGLVWYYGYPINRIYKLTERFLIYVKHILQTSNCYDFHK